MALGIHYGKKIDGWLHMNNQVPPALYMIHADAISNLIIENRCLNQCFKKISYCILCNVQYVTVVYIGDQSGGWGGLSTLSTHPGSATLTLHVEEGCIGKGTTRTLSWPTCVIIFLSDLFFIIP